MRKRTRTYPAAYIAQTWGDIVEVDLYFLVAYDVKSCKWKERIHKPSKPGRIFSHLLTEQNTPVNLERVIRLFQFSSPLEAHSAMRALAAKVNYSTTHSLVITKPQNSLHLLTVKYELQLLKQSQN